MKRLILGAAVALGFVGAMVFSPAAWACCGPIDQPEITAVNSDPLFLWPPNHKMVEIQLEVLGNDYVAADRWAVSGVTVLNQGPGEGNPSNDPDYYYNGQYLELRAERSGAAGMRTYAVVVRAWNADETLFDTFTKMINVPHDMGDD